MTLATTRIRAARSLGNVSCNFYTVSLVQWTAASNGPSPLRSRAQWRCKTTKSTGKRFADILKPEPELEPGNSRAPIFLDLELSKEPIWPPINLAPLKVTGANQTLYNTYPPPLGDVAPAMPDDHDKVSMKERVKYYYRLGKSYLTFYKTGLKRTWTNYKEMRQIQERIKPFTLQEAAVYGGTSFPGGGEVHSISRRDFQFCLRTQHDLKKLIPFALVLMICGEFTPLAILALGSTVVPYTCRIPQQQEKDMARPQHRWSKVVAASRETDEFRKHVPAANRYLWWTRNAEVEFRCEFIAAYNLGLSPFSKPIPILSYLFFQLFVRRRFRRHFKNLFCDAVLLRREGGLSKLTPIELYLYAQNFISPALPPWFWYAVIKDITLTTDPFKKRFAPALDADLDSMLKVDYTRVDPRNQWMAAWRATRLAPHGRILMQQLYEEVKSLGYSFRTSEDLKGSPRLR